jgi:hypothetical protein
MTMPSSQQPYDCYGSYDQNAVSEYSQDERSPYDYHWCSAPRATIGTIPRNIDRGVTSFAQYLILVQRHCGSHKDYRRRLPSPTTPATPPALVTGLPVPPHATTTTTVTKGGATTSRYNQHKLVPQHRVPTGYVYDWIHHNNATATRIL